jgi:hypothetical protein
LEGNLKDDKRRMVGLGGVGKTQHDFGGAHVIGSVVDGSDLGILVPRRLARAAPSR